MIKSILISLIIVTMSSCVGIIKIFEPGAYSSNQVFKSAKKIAKSEKKYYGIKKDGDSILMTSKETMSILKKKACESCKINPSELIEYSTKYGIARRWGGDEWLTYLVKGKLNVYYTYIATGSYTQHNYSPNGHMSTSTVTTHRFIFYFGNGQQGIVNFLPEYIRTAFSDNKECLRELNAIIKKNSTSIKENQYMPIIKVIKKYNSK